MVCNCACVLVLVLFSVLSALVLLCFQPVLCAAAEHRYATLLPIRSVGVQGDCRTYSYVACFSADALAPASAPSLSKRSLSSASDVPMLESDSTPAPAPAPAPAAAAAVSEAAESPAVACAPARELSVEEQRQQWLALKFFAKMVPKICRNINRIVFAFGGAVRYSVNDVTPTFLVPSTVAILRRADAVANRVLRESGAPSPSFHYTNAFTTLAYRFSSAFLQFTVHSSLISSRYRLLPTA